MTDAQKIILRETIKAQSKTLDDKTEYLLNSYGLKYTKKDLTNDRCTKTNKARK